MKTTMNLLEAALKLQPIPYWTKRLQLGQSTLSVCKNRQSMSPSITGALAEELGEEDVKGWIAIAALENDADSHCKRRMLASFRENKTMKAGTKKAPLTTQSNLDLLSESESPLSIW